ncbi:hypothetical protein YPPY103_1628, partial [Yersinia pestis PY-103]
MLDLQNTK